MKFNKKKGGNCNELLSSIIPLKNISINSDINTLISNSFVNSGRNPVTELFYGDGSLVNPIGFTRFIFDLDLSLLEEIKTGYRRHSIKLLVNCLKEDHV